MHDSRDIEFTVILSSREAWEFAQFLKRVEFDTYLYYVEVGRPTDQRKEVAYQMVDAGEKIRKALTEVGYSPR